MPILTSINLASLTGIVRAGNGFRIDGQAAFDYSGTAVASAGDINNDGFADLLVSSPYASPNGGTSGASFVLFGKAGSYGATLNLSALDGSNGFQINGESIFSISGFSISTAGDVNKDGFDDVIIGTKKDGLSYVVFGKASGYGAALNLSDLDGSNGFEIKSDLVPIVGGGGVASAGDMNNDGFADIVIGMSGTKPNGLSADGSSYVVFGKAAGYSAVFELSSLNGSNGFRIDGASANENSGASVASAGDINKDGFDDLIIAAPNAGPNGNGSGASYILFGKSSGYAPVINLATLDGVNGFKIAGTSAADNSGLSVASAGDVNKDGFDDLIIGAPDADPNGASSGASYVIFGKATGYQPVFELASLDGKNGFMIAGEMPRDRSGFSVSSAGDINNDGYDDLLIGASEAAPNGTYSGASYVVYGKASGFAPRLDLVALTGFDGFKISGIAAGDSTGSAVSAAGDINKDGFDDLIVGGYGADPNGDDSGSSYVIYGGPSQIADVIKLDDEALAFSSATMMMRAGAVFSATLADGSALPGKLSIDAATGTITGLLPSTFVGSLAVTVRADYAGGDFFTDSFTLTTPLLPKATGSRDTLTGSKKDNKGTLGAGNDRYDAREGNDIVLGGVGRDDIKGGRGNDRIYGQSGRDTLDGGKGNDLLKGGTGRDVLTGGAGSDTFVFSNLGSRDKVQDFNVKADRIQLDQEVFASLSLGKLDEDAFRIGKTAKAADDHIIYNSKTGTLGYDADGKGGAAAIVFADIGKGLKLTADDFLVV